MPRRFDSLAIALLLMVAALQAGTSHGAQPAAFASQTGDAVAINGNGLAHRMQHAVWMTKVGPAGHHPPEHFASRIACPLLDVSLIWAVRRRPSPAPA